MEILLIEDEPIFAGLIRETYREESIHVVGTLAAALDYLKVNSPSLILVDLGLPDSFGVETLKALDKVNKPKAVITGTPGLASEIAQLGAADYIIKDGNLERAMKRVGFNIEKFRPRKKIRF